jgi:hypothetical protein
MLEYEAQAFAGALQWRIPLTIPEVQAAIGSGVSSREFNERLELAANATYNVPNETRSQLFNLYGIDDGQIAKAFLDPKREFSRLNTMFGAAGIAGAASQSGWGNLNATQAENLFRGGLNQQTATKSFSDLYNLRGLFESTDTTERWITPEDQVNLILGNAVLQEEVNKRVSKRLAASQAGGEAAKSETGLSGFGIAQ